MKLIQHRRVFTKHLVFLPVFSTFYYFSDDLKATIWFTKFKHYVRRARGAIMNIFTKQIFHLKAREGPPEPTGPPFGTGPPGCGPPSGAGPPGKKNQPQRCRDGPGWIEKRLTFLTNEILMKRGIQP